MAALRGWRRALAAFLAGGLSVAALAPVQIFAVLFVSLRGGWLEATLAGITLAMGILPEILRSAMGDFIVWQEFVYGLILVLSITLMPQGIWGLYQRLTQKKRRAA